MARTTEKPKEGMGARVERERLKRGWSQEDLAEKLHTTRSSVKNKELGERPFSLEETKILCNLFHVNLDYLVNGVATKYISAHEDLGLSHNTISMMKEFSLREPELVEEVDKVLGSYWVLKAIGMFMKHSVEKEGHFLSETIQRKGSFEVCTMSQQFTEGALKQYITDAMQEVKDGKNTISYFDAVEDFESCVEEDQKLAERNGYEGANQDAEKK